MLFGIAAVLVGLASAKYLLSGDGGVGETYYIPPTPEEIEEIARRQSESEQRWQEFCDHTPIGIFGTKVAETLEWLTFYSPAWIWFALLGMLVVIFIVLMVLSANEEDQYTIKRPLAFMGSFAIGMVVLLLLAVDSLFLVIRFVAWLFTPVY